MKRSSPTRNQEYNSLAMDEEDPTGDFAAMSMDEGTHSHPTSPTINNNNIHNNINIQQRKKNGLREKLHEFKVMSMPYFQENRNGRILFAIMVVLTLANSAVRVFFSYLARDFWSALSDKKVEEFYTIMTSPSSSSSLPPSSSSLSARSPTFPAPAKVASHAAVICASVTSSSACP